MSVPRATPISYPDAPTRVELDALSQIYARAIARFEEGPAKKKAAEGHHPDGQNDGTESKEDSADAPIIPGQ